MSQFLTAIVSIAAIFIVATVLIITHEFGHYLAARAVGLTAQRFTVGFGPNLLRLTDRRGTIWSLSALPIGGFVSFADERDPSQPGSYAALRPPARAAIILAGPAANAVLAIGLYACILAIQGQTTLLPIATAVLPGSPAAVAGLRPGDQIQAIDNVSVKSFSDIGRLLRSHPGETIRLTVGREGREVQLTPHLQTKGDGDHRIGFLGVESHALGHRALSLWQIAIYAPARAWTVIADMVSGIAAALTTGKGANQLTGILGVTQLAGQAAAAGTPSLLALAAVLSINLALMNLLPIPILDGGALLFCLIEWVRGRPAPASFQDLATRLGAAAIAASFAFFILHDLAGFGVLQWMPKL